MTISTSDRCEDLIRGQARALGFDICRFTPIADAWSAGARLSEFVAVGRHGEMDWMLETEARRAHPRAMWPQARSAIVVGMNYGPIGDPLTVLGESTKGAISVYAQGDDYHQLMKGRLKNLSSWLQARFGGNQRVFVDTAPLLEKPLAEQAGMGWQGKHTNLVSREFGSWLFLGSILTTLELAPDGVEIATCGACRACLDICPTNAFPAPYQLDARRCISYLTIELTGPIPHEFRELLGNRIYGCDDCLAVCPWNKFAQVAAEQRLHAREALKAPSLADLARLDEPAFRALFAKSPVKRIGRDPFIRNVLYAIGNSAEPALEAEAQRLLGDPSPLVRGAAVWALGRLLKAKAFKRLRSGQVETDPMVLEEWAHAQTANARESGDERLKIGLAANP